VFDALAETQGQILVEAKLSLTNERFYGLKPSFCSSMANQTVLGAFDQPLEAELHSNKNDVELVCIARQVIMPKKLRLERLVR
jgi:hypothetical protein